MCSPSDSSLLEASGEGEGQPRGARARRRQPAPRCPPPARLVAEVKVPVVLLGPPTLPAMLVVELGEASFSSQMPFRPGAGPPPPALCQQGPGQDAFIFKPENNAWPALLPKRTEGARVGWEPHFLGRHSLPPDRCQGDSARPPSGTQRIRILEPSPAPVPHCWDKPPTPDRHG